MAIDGGVFWLMIERYNKKRSKGGGEEETEEFHL